MKRTIVICLTLASLMLAHGIATAQPRANLAQDRDAIANGWQFDYAAAKESARKSNKPLMIVFRCVP
jgi:hypothetical protein